jgi:GNAT superfamily N-acetyltransferase
VNYEVVKYRTEFKDQVAELQKNLWSFDAALNTAYLEWKYECNPYQPEPLIYLALLAGQVVGMRGLFGAKWQVGHSGQVFGSCAGDLVIDPEHRKRGLFKLIMAAALEDLAHRGHPYVFNLSGGSKPETYFSSLATGWRGIGSFQPMQWINPNGFLDPASGERRHPMEFLDRNGEAPGGPLGVSVKIERTPRSKAMAELVEGIESDGRLRHIRDERYFAWRFQNPLSVYRFLYWEDIQLQGYLVLRTSFDAEWAFIEIVDWEARNAQVRADLLRAAIEWGRFDGLTIWSATLPVEAKTLLQNAGFEPLEQDESLEGPRPTVLIRAVRDDVLPEDWVLDGISLLDLNNWDLRMIYSDGC